MTDLSPFKNSNNDVVQFLDSFEQDSNLRLTSNLQDEMKATIEKGLELSPQMNTSIYKMVETPSTNQRFAKKPEIYIKKKLNL